jgi:hypothetical protein
LYSCLAAKGSFDVAAEKELKNRPATRAAVRDAIVARAPAKAIPGDSAALASLVDGLSQVVSTFGPGAMVDLPTRSVVIGGLEHTMMQDMMGVGGMWAWA